MGVLENECQISQECETTGKILKTLCFRCQFVKCDIDHFLELP